jgi:hypothetical protein
MQTTFYDRIQALQADLDKSLNHYNYERPHRGYRNLGKRPGDPLAHFSIAGWT